MKYQTETGEYKEAQYDGISARVVQHEIDHLNGITFDARAKPLALKPAYGQQDLWALEQWPSSRLF
ncbi:MAG: peptide deformylase [bacterium]